MKAKSFALLMLAAILTVSVLVSGCGPAPVDASAPEETVDAFYRWFLGYPGNALADHAYRNSEYLTEEFIATVDQTLAGFTHGGFDPFLCAQDIPQDINVETVSVGEDEALVILHEYWNPGTQLEQVRDLEITLRLVDGTWKIDGITCPGMEGGAQAPPPPEQTVESFYAWYLDYARNQGNPLVDQAYQNSAYLTAGFVQEIDLLLSSMENGGYDPFLCAQDVPDSISTGMAEGSANTARVPVTTSFEGHSFTVELELHGGTWLISDVQCSETAGEQIEVQMVEVPELNLTFDVPAGWTRLEDEWVWTSDGSAHVGFHWTELEPPMELEAALLPSNAQILESGSVPLPWGSGRSFTVEVYTPVAEGEDTPAPVESVETHVLSTLDREATRYALDFYVRGEDFEQLVALTPILEHMVDSAALGGPAASGGGTEGTGETASWPLFRDEEYGFEIRYPPGWTFQELELLYPEQSAPVVRIVQFLPEEWAEQMNPGRSPDPNAPVIVAPLSLEVSVGTEEEYRRMYSPPAVSVEMQFGPYTVIREEDSPGDYRMIRYIFQHTVNENLRVTLVDQLSGFSARVPGNEGVIAQAEQMLTTFRFTE